MRKAWMGAALMTLWVAGTANAGPLATVEMREGAVIEAEIRDFSDGLFTLRDLQTEQVVGVNEEDIRAIRFKSSTTTTLPATPVKPVDMEITRRMLSEGRHLLLAGMFHTSVNREGPKRVQEIEAQIAKELERRDLTLMERRDWRIAQALAAQAQGPSPRVRTLFTALRTDYPSDPIVQNLERDLRTMRERRPPARPARPGDARP